VRGEGAKLTEGVVRASFAPLDAREREVLGDMLERPLAG
jgi:hypothetical protein